MPYYYVMEMPLTADGHGPVTDGTHAKMTWEIWNQHLVSIASYESRESALRAMAVLNEDMEVEIDRAVRGARGMPPMWDRNDMTRCSVCGIPSVDAMNRPMAMGYVCGNSKCPTRMT